MCVQLMLLLLAASGSAMRVFTSGEVKAVNGTDVRLKCTFQSWAELRSSSVSVSWSFRPQGPGAEETVLYFQQQVFLPPDGRFRRRVDWAGDVGARDASVVLRRVPFTFNGTFSCQVKNPPDVHGNVGEVRLRVVATASLSGLLLLCVSCGGAALLLLLCLACVWRCVRRQGPGYKEPTGH